MSSPPTAPNPQPGTVLNYSLKRRSGVDPQTLRLVWPLVALAVILVINLIRLKGQFFHLGYFNGRLTGNIVDIFKNAVPVGLISLGMCVVIATGGIDLSVGAVMACVGVFAVSLIARPMDNNNAHYLSFAGAINVHNSLTLVFILSLLLAILLGLYNGVLVAVFGIQPIIATLVLMVSGRGLAQFIGGEQTVNISDLEPFARFAGGNVLWLPSSIAVLAVMFILAIVLTRGTALGLFLESSGNNPTASRYAGVNAKLVTLAAYVFSGFCAGLAGLIYASENRSVNPGQVGTYTELSAILAVSIGGTALTGGRFSLLGAIIGSIVIQTLETTILANDIQREWSLIIEALVVVLVCLLQSDKFRKSVAGFFPKR